MDPVACGLVASREAILWIGISGSQIWQQMTNPFLALPENLLAENGGSSFLRENGFILSVATGVLKIFEYDANLRIRCAAICSS